MRAILMPGHCGRAGLAAAVVVLAGACDYLAAPFPDTPPTAFHVTVDGWVYGSYDVELRGDTLVSVRVPDFQPDSAQIYRTVPTRADWQAFWSAARAAGLGSWPHECRNTNVMDGGGYSVQITYPGGQVVASGVNAWPRRVGRCDPNSTTPEWTTFTTAVSTLIGRTFP